MERKFTQMLGIKWFLLYFVGINFNGMEKKKREQEGIIHVYFRANGRYTVFYDDEDNLELLRKMDKFAKKYDSKILDFVLMGNHAHFLVNTTCVTELMRDTLRSYSRWYNKKYKNSNKIFKTPFSSACKRSNEWVLDSCCYILLNPVTAGMCGKVENYRWSSACMHFINDKRRYVPIGYMQHLRLCSAIEVDTSFIDSYFKSYREFLDFVNYNNVAKSSVVPASSVWEVSTISNLTAAVQKLLGGRVLSSLSREEMKSLIVDLFKCTRGKMFQIASVLHIDYKFVKKCIQTYESLNTPQPE